eukprot:snap_masked-scaffold_70-processed-gene-0.79-mRNA-1 protein AED:1.00 eAED:1.00 QI:0/0/0/0/1/1/3/0/230
MQKDETNGIKLKPDVLDPEEQSKSEVFENWTSATYSTLEKMLEVINLPVVALRGEFVFVTTLTRKSALLNGVGTEKDLRDCSLDKKCSFDVNIKHDLETFKYIFVVINKNHCNHKEKALGKITKYAQKLTAEELKRIKQFGAADSGIAAADVALYGNFPGTFFDKILVKQTVEKAKEGVDTGEDNNIKKLITCGKRCLERGGNFDLTWGYPKEGKVMLNGVSFQNACKIN